MVRTARMPVNEQGKTIRLETAAMTFSEPRYVPRDYTVQRNRVRAETEREVTTHGDGRFPGNVISTLKEMGYE